MDIKGIGYLISAISVGIFALLAWPAPDEPQWKAWAVVIGFITAVAGMAVRYMSHRKDHPGIAKGKIGAALREKGN